MVSHSSGSPSCSRSQHRGWKRQPDGGAAGDGTSPLSTSRLERRRGSGTGTADSSATVYGCLGAVYIWSTGASSTILPRYITPTRSLRYWTTDRLWATNRYVKPEVPPQVQQQVEDLGLDGHVERGHRLVADDELGLQHQGARDADALSLAARELVREAPGVVTAESHDLQVVADPLLADRGVAPAVLLVRLGDEPLADDVADRHPRVERADRVLEHDLHPAAEPLELVALLVEDVLAPQRDRARGGRQQLQQRLAQRRLAAARLAHEAQDLAGTDVEGDAIDGAHVAHVPAHDAAEDGVVLDQVLDRRRAARPGRCPRSRRQPPPPASVAGAGGASAPGATTSVTLRPPGPRSGRWWRRSPTASATRLAAATWASLSRLGMSKPGRLLPQPARDGRPVALVRPRVERGAGVEPVRAAGREVAARGHVERVGHRALDDVQPLAAHALRGDRRQQALRVRDGAAGAAPRPRCRAPRPGRRTSPPRRRPSRRPHPGRG